MHVQSEIQAKLIRQQKVLKVWEGKYLRKNHISQAGAAADSAHYGKFVKRV